MYDVAKPKPDDIKFSGTHEGFDYRYVEVKPGFMEWQTAVTGGIHFRNCTIIPKPMAFAWAEHMRDVFNGMVRGQGECVNEWMEWVQTTKPWENNKQQQGKSFFQLWTEGNALPDEIDNFISKWHDYDQGMALHDFLGLTFEEYSDYVKHPDGVIFILKNKLAKAGSTCFF